MTYFIFLHESLVINTFTTEKGSLRNVYVTLSKIDPVFKERELKRLNDPIDLGFYFTDSHPIQFSEFERAIRTLKETLAIALSDEATSGTPLLN